MVRSHHHPHSAYVPLDKLDKMSNHGNVMEQDFDPGTAPEEPQQASNLDEKFGSSPSVSPESEQQKAREKMGVLIGRLDTSVKEKGVIAMVVGDKDETGDHRAAILTEPIIQGEEGNRYVGYVVLTPDGPMIIDTSDGISGGRAVIDFMARDLGPEDYAKQREFLKGLKYMSQPMGSIMTYRLEGQVGIRPMTIYIQPPERSRMRNVNIEDQFEKSMARAAKPLEKLKSQATDTSNLADSLNARL